VKAKHLAANPAEGIELPRLPEGEQRYLTHEQLHRVAVACGRYRTMIFVLGYCGLRFGEAAALKVADVDIAGRRIRVRRSVTYVTGTGLVEGAPKNHTARTVPVPAFVAGLLATELEDRGGDELAFPPPAASTWPSRMCAIRSRRPSRRSAVPACGYTICGTPAPRWRSAPGPTSRWCSGYLGTRRRR
jgi:integrase